MQRENGNKIRCHSKLDLESSTYVVTQAKQQRQAWKTLNQVQGDDLVCYNCNSAFTLIELLVVVLIIGILAAVALPQYQKAVHKSKMTEAMAVLTATAKAEHVYFLANGEYTTDFSSLDLGPENTTFSTNWTALVLDINGGRPHLETRAKFLPLAVYLVYQLDEDKIYCSQSSAAKTQQVCQRLYGHRETVVDPSNSSYDMYVISQ